MTVANRLLTLGLEPLNLLLDLAERNCLRPRERFTHPPVLILGAPRSGSTLLYQVLAARFRFGYLSNLHHRLYGAPVMLEHVLRSRLRAGGGATFRSEDGRTAGLLSPSEAPRFWYRWFPRRPQYQELTPGVIDRLRSLRQVLMALTEVRGSPFLFKTLSNSLRIRPIAAAVPETLFVVIHRHPAEVAASLLQGRRRVHGTTRRWWSIEPEDIAHLRTLPPEAQVVGQVASINRTILRDAAMAGADRFLHLAYDDLCTAPEATADRVGEHIRKHGWNLPVAGVVPASFPLQGVRDLPVNERASLVAALADQFPGCWGPPGEERPL